MSLSLYYANTRNLLKFTFKKHSNKILLTIKLLCRLGSAKHVKRANSNQIWIYTDVEPDPGTYENSIYFNWTFTYHSDSDAVAFYGYFVPLNQSFR